MRRLALKFLPTKLIGLISAVVVRPKRSYSTFGEDLVIERLVLELIGRRPGFYVDVGAFHPTYGSNTRRLYDAGWRGLNIDADPNKIHLLNTFRARDINVCAAVAAEEREAQFFTHEGVKYSSMSGLDRQGVEQSASALGRNITSRTVRTRTLESILAERGVSAVDFLNIDIEGSEAEVLASVDLTRYGVQLIACEIRETHLEAMLDSPAALFLATRGYAMVAWTPPTVFFQSAHAERARYGSEQNDADRVW